MKDCPTCGHPLTDESTGRDNDWQTLHCGRCGTLVMIDDGGLDPTPRVTVPKLVERWVENSLRRKRNANH